MSCSGKSHSRRPTKQELGRSFELAAARFYEDEGYTVLEKNWRAGHKEIDLIVQKDRLVVFVEVKATSSDSFGHPAEKVTPKKIQNLSQAAQRYVIEKKVGECDLRFDVVTFLNGKMEHFPDAFQAES